MSNIKRIQLLLIIWLTVNAYAQNTNPIANIPFEIDDGHIFIQLSINQSEQLHFIFDTGANATVINPETAKRLNFSSNKASTATGASGETKSSIIKDKSIKVGSIQLERIDLLSIPLSHLEKAMGKNIDGIIGFDLLERFVVEINYDKSELICYESKSYTYQGSGELVKIKGSLPMAAFQVILKDGSYVDEKFMLDTGADIAIGFTSPFSKRSQIKRKIGKTYVNNARGLSATSTQVDVGRIKNLKISNFEFEQIPVYIYDTKVGFFASKKVAGIIGNEILKRFNITFDYGRNRSYWVKNKKFINEAFHVQSSGLKLSVDSNRSKVLIDFIIPNSSAAKSELKIGDEIVEIDGVKAKDSSLSILRKLLITQSEKEVKVIYKRDNKVKELFLSLEPLI